MLCDPGAFVMGAAPRHSRCLLLQNGFMVFDATGMRVPDVHREGILAVCAAVFFAAIALIWPLFRNGFPPRTHDSRIQSVWSSQFAKQFWHGEVYPRWLAEVNGGLGSPAFFYYPPLPHLLTATLSPLVSTNAWWRAMGLSAGVSFALSGFFALLWLRQIVPLWPAAGGAISYLFMPYHLLIDLYTRGAFAEFWGMTWLPLVLWCTDRCVAGGRQAIAAFALAYALLITSHLPTTLVFAVLPPIYCILIPAAGQRRTALHRTVAGMMLGMGLAAVYLIPALTLQSSVSMKELTRFGYQKFFLLSHDPGELEVHLFWIVLSMLAVGVCMAALTLSNDAAARRRQALFWCAAGGLSAFMMVPVSKPVWELVSTLQIIQFPWRFATVLSVAIAALVALGLAAIKRPYRWQNVAYAQAGWTIFVGWLYVSITGAWPCFSKQISAATDPLLRDVPEYRPHWVHAELESTVAKFGELPAKKVVFAQGGGTVEVASWKPRRIALLATVTNAGTMLVRQYYFPGWTAWVDGKRSKVEISEPDGLVQLSVAPGAHQIELRLVPTIQERLGQIISGVSLCVVVGLVVWEWRRHRQGAKQQEKLEAKSGALDAPALP